ALTRGSSRRRWVRARPRAALTQPPHPAAVGIHRAPAQKAGSARRKRLTPLQRSLALAGLAWFLVLVAAVTGYWVLQPVLRDPLASDFTLVFIAVRIGTEHGWSHIYSLQLQHQLFSELRPGVFFNDGQRFIAPPPLAWLTVPLTPFGAAGAFYAWTLLSVVALLAAWWIAAPGAGLRRWLWLLAAVAWYPVLYGLAFGQPALVVLLTVAAAWELLESGGPVPGG